MESFWRSWDNSLSESLLCYCIFYSATRGTGSAGVQGLAYHFYDKLRSQFNYERIFWKQSKRYCGNSSTEIKRLVSSCLKWREF